MSAIEYGSYYWCVLLNRERDGEHGQSGDSIYLHADEMSIEGGTLTFKSAGRRPAGSEIVTVPIICWRPGQQPPDGFLPLEVYDEQARGYRPVPSAEAIEGKP